MLNKKVPNKDTLKYFNQDNIFKLTQNWRK